MSRDLLPSPLLLRPWTNRDLTAKRHLHYQICMKEIGELREKVSSKAIFFENIDGVLRRTWSLYVGLPIQDRHEISAARNTTNLQTKLTRERTEAVVARGYFTLIYRQIEFAFAKL